MKLSRRLLISNELIQIVAIISTLLVFIIQIIKLSPIESLKSNMNLIIAAAFFGSIIASVIVTLIQSPILLTISLLGFPNVGKTVYLTVLFDQLQRTEETSIQFTPYGTETVEEVSKNLNKLSEGVWVPPTSPNTVFLYRAKASIRSGLIRRRYKIEIGDFAGQRIGEFDSFNDKWLHRSDYFKYVIQSEAILLAIDCKVLIEHDRTKIEEMQNALVAAIQILIEMKGVTRRLRVPVALLFLKTDLLKNSDIHKEELPFMVPKLINVCQQNCENFSYFFVSSVGDLGPDESPPKVITPQNVVDPIVWILKKV